VIFSKTSEYIMIASKEIKQRGLIYKWHHLPYNPSLIPRVKELRKHMTPAEQKLWSNFLSAFPHRVLSQRPIDNYIVDFYCPFFKMVIEIDGEQHYTEEGKAYDAERDGILASYGLKVLRVKNTELIENFRVVCEKITRFAYQ
jgi:very-short-patch-repair endonuclease